MRVFVGGYTENITDDWKAKGEGIYCFDFNPGDGQLKLNDITKALNPSYLTLSENGQFLYAVEEVPVDRNPKINAFRVNPEGSEKSLTLINSEELPGSFACHLSLTSSGTHLVIASYMSGNVLVYPLGKGGEVLPLSQNLQHEGSGPDAERQEGPHPHMVYPFGRDGIFIVDLGLDAAKYYSFDEYSGKLEPKPDFDLNVKKGAGARHMAVHPGSKYAFIFSELTSEVFTFINNGSRFEPAGVIASLSDSFNGKPSGAALRIHPEGRYLYVSNRNDNSITAFSFDENTGELSLTGYYDTGGVRPRDFNIDPAGRWLMVPNMESDNMVVFAVNPDGSLEKEYVIHDVKTASCLQFL